MGYSKKLTQNSKHLSVPLSPTMIEHIVTLRNYYKLESNVELIRKVLEDKYNEIV
jgi:hypothetical protein